MNSYLTPIHLIDDRERTISTSSVHSSILDDDQKSTSTASEAEEQRLSIATEPPKSKSVDCSLTAANIAALQADYAVKQRNEVGKVTISSPVKLVEQAPQKSPKPAPRVGYQKSPMKLYGQPSGRSATPSPPSNIVSFFPRFNCGGGGSPPLMVGEDLPYPTPRMVARKVDKGSVFGSVPSNPVYRVLNNQPTNVDEKSTLNRQTAAVTNSPNQSMKPTLYGNPPNGPLPTFSGYQVKVKYVPTSTTTPQFALNQSNVPMKKRHYVSTNEMTSPKQVRRDDGPKMTSLYIGASAAVLDQQNDRVNSTTSDNESDRESPMLNDPKRGQFRHWRKHITDRGGREWNEYRTKKDEGKKLMLHQYEPAVTNATKFHSKPKTTFALWDKKHHAISMDAVTSGKSKQTPPLIAPKSTAPTPNTTQSHSITQVCYTTLKKPSKPISTVVPQSVSPLVGVTEQQTKTDFHLLPATPSTQAVKQMLQAVTDTSANHSFEVVHSKPNSNVISSNLPPISTPVVSNNQPPIPNHTAPNLPLISNPTSSGESPIQTSLPVVLTTNDGTVAKQQNILPPHGAMPLMIPVGYVMYQGGIPTSGLQFTPKTTHAGAFPDLLPMQTFQVQPADPGLVRVAPKRTMTPNRGRSESFPNSAVSSDSLEPPSEKKSKMNQLDSPSMCIVTPPARPTLQSQLVFPGNFILPGGGGAILGYPMQHYPTSQALQPIHMGSIGAGQNMASLSQIWPMNAGLGLQFATSGVTMPTVVASQQAPLALQVINTSNTGPS
uniref:Btz domain-containing protein n=1 Tax=Ciona savignyi TaxID=51511 RepID=H2Y4K5_CIOSA